MFNTHIGQITVSVTLVLITVNIYMTENHWMATTERSVRTYETWSGSIKNKYVHMHSEANF